MLHIYKIHKLLHIKKELKEVYTNQVIEALALSIIGIFIPAYLISIGFAFRDVVLFEIVKWSSAFFMGPLSAKINSRIGVKHTILLRSPVLISFLAIIMNIESLLDFFFPASVMMGISTSLYYTSISTEYIRTSDRRKEGEEAGLLYGIPHISAVVGPLIGAAVLTLFGFPVLFAFAVALVLISVAPLFLSSDYKSKGFRIRGFDIFLNKWKATHFFAHGSILLADLTFWGLYVFLNFGFISLGIAASLMGLGMVLFTVIVGGISNKARGRIRITRIGGFLTAILFIMRITVTTELEFMVLSLLGGFVIMSYSVSLFADFSLFAKDNGPARSVVFRYFWINLGRVIPMLMIFLFLPGLGAIQFIQAMFIVTAFISLMLITFK